MLHHITSGDIRSDTLASRDDNTDDTVFEVNPITRLLLDKTSPNAPTHVAQLSAFTDSVPDDHAADVRNTLVIPE